MKKRDIVTRSKTGSLQPRTFNMEELKKKERMLNKALEKREREFQDMNDLNGSRLTRLKAQQISTGKSGSLLFR